MDLNDDRKFITSRRVRVSDSGTDGVIRIDAIARYLQDVGFDDTNDIGVCDGGTWVARTIQIDFPKKEFWPKRNEVVNIQTYCGGYGSAFAQRNVEVSTKASPISASTIWVHIDERGKPAKIPDWLKSAYPNARKISSPKLSILPQMEGEISEINFQLRQKDLDVNGHVNNAVFFEALIDIAGFIEAKDPCRVIMEYVKPVDVGEKIRLSVKKKIDGFEAWLKTEQNIACQMKWIV